LATENEESLHQLAELLCQVDDYFFLHHAPSLSERFSLNNIEITGIRQLSAVMHVVAQYIAPLHA
jgi:hypothetical protein